MQLSVKDVAHILNVDDKTVYGWIKQENIPVYRVGETFRFNRADILEWATARQMAHAVPEADAPDQLTGLADALETGGIVYGVKGGDKPAVLRNVVNAMQLADEVDRDFLYDGLLITGPVTQNMKSALLDTYEAVPEPKLVIATGACAISGGPFIDHSQTGNGADSVLPVDLYIPGCPPHPLTILDGLLRLIGRIPSKAPRGVK